MSKAARIWFNMLIIFTLLMSIIPVSGIIEAAEYESPIVISDPMGTEGDPTQVTTKEISLSGSFYGVSDLSYTVTQLRRLSNDSLVEIQSTEGVEKAQVTGSTFKFNNVQLFDGLNKIRVKGKNSNGTSTSSESVYVEYSKLPIILSVKYGEQDLKTSPTPVISTKLFNDELVLKGEVHNADKIVAKINGEATEYTGSILNNNTYVIAELPLQRGNNIIELVASNTTKAYPVRVEVIYNDGKPYIGDAEIKNSSGTFVELKNSMNIATSTLEISGTINGFDDGYTLDIFFNDSDEILSITKEQFSGLAVGATISNTLITFTKSTANNFTLDLARVNENSMNILKFNFKKGLAEEYKQTYYLDHYDPNANFITNVSGLGNSVTTTTNKKHKFYVYTKLDNPIYVEKDGTQIFELVGYPKPQADEWMHAFEVNLNPGFNAITIRPNDPDTTNMKSYSIQYINSPDVKVLSHVNGDRIGEGGQGTTLYGELVNIELADRIKTEVTISNSGGKSSFLLTSFHFDNPDQYRFELDLDGLLQTGANEILIEVTDGTIKTETRLTLFYFSDNGPWATLNYELVLPDDRLIETAIPGNYETDARFIHFTGEYSNAETLMFYINGLRVNEEGTKLDGTGIERVEGMDPISEEGVYIEIDESTSSFSTKYPIFLHEGTNVFEVEAISTSGASWNDKIYIKRTNPPVKIIKPDLVKEKVVNSNFIEVEILVASADSIIIDKEEATYLKLTNDELRTVIDELGKDVIEKYNLDNDDGPDGILTIADLSDAEIEAIDQSEVVGKRFTADVFLKPGRNKIKYEVIKGDNKTKYEFEIFYADSPDEGARYKEEFDDKMDAFDKRIQLEFPKNTWLIEPSTNTPVYNQYQDSAFLEFGIVDKQTGKLIKKWEDGTLEEFNEPFKTFMPIRVIPPDRTGYAGQIYWIEADGDMRNVDSGYIPTNRGELKLQYDPSIRNDAQNLLSVYHFDRKEKQWINIGGVVDTKKNTVTAMIDEFGYYTVMAKRGTYNDILEHSWAANYLQTMFAKGLMKPESYNRFGSDLLTSRGEFATLLVKALDIPINAGPYIDSDKMYPVNPTFVDVNPLLDPSNGFYSYEYIETAGRAGIVRGMGQGEFNPDGLLTREQAAIMIARAANFKLTSNMEKAKAALMKEYADAEKINDYSAVYVLAVTKEDIMGGSKAGETFVFNPRSFMSRAEAAAISYRLMQDLKKLPK